MASVYLADSWDNHGPLQAPGPEFARIMMERILSQTDSLSHLLGQSLIKIDGDEARAETYFFAVSQMADDDGVPQCRQLGGRFVDHLIRIDDGWKIKHRVAVRDWSISIPVHRDWDARYLPPGGRGSADPAFAALGLLGNAAHARSLGDTMPDTTLPDRGQIPAIAEPVLAQIRAREIEVLGQPPRVAPLDRQSVAAEVQAATALLRGGVVGAPAPMPLDAIPEIMFTMQRYPELWQKLMALTVQIQGPESVLPLRDRKLAILRIGWLCQAPYEFGEHVNQAKRAGFTGDEIDRITIGSAAPGWDDHERAVLRAAEECIASAMVSDPTWDRLAKTLSDHQMVELLVLIGQFVATAYFQNSLRLRLEAANKGLSAR